MEQGEVSSSAAFGRGSSKMARIRAFVVVGTAAKTDYCCFIAAGTAGLAR